jgi:SAM-dependent methyltransferase
MVLDVREPFPFSDRAFDLVVANMLFNELGPAALRHALGECGRVLGGGGRLLATVTHPAFVASLARRGELRPLAGAVQTMPGADGLRLPVVLRRAAEYVTPAGQAGFRVESQDVHPTGKVLAAKPGLRKDGGAPIALLLDCVRFAARPEQGGRTAGA